MNIWAIGDLHLAHSLPDKSMSRLLPSWTNYEKKIQESWDRSVRQDDLVLIPGDISWAMRMHEVLPDLEFIAQRPGIKVMIRGNHDFWWDTATKVRNVLPKDVHIIHNDSFSYGPIAIAGARLWESSEYSFRSVIDFQEGIGKGENSNPVEEDEKIFQRELLRLESSLKLLPATADTKIALTHFPPIGLNLAPSKASALFEKYGIQYAIFGHLHSIRPNCSSLFGQARGIEYILASADWLKFEPKLICSF